MDKKNYGKAFKEVYMILKSIDDDVRKKIPIEFLTFIEENMDINYFFLLDQTIPLEEQTFMDETLGIISLIWRDYLCSDEEKKQMQMRDAQTLKDMQFQIEEDLRKKYNIDNLFRNKK